MEIRHSDVLGFLAIALPSYGTRELKELLRMTTRKKRDCGLFGKANRKSRALLS